MLIVQFAVNAVPGTEQDIKEVIAMYCEPLGRTEFLDVQFQNYEMILTAQISPGGDVYTFRKKFAEYLKVYKDTRILTIQEYLPQQLNLQGE